MKTIKEEIEVLSPQEELFDLTQDYQRRLEWDPYLREAYLLNGAVDAEVGVQSVCTNHRGSVMVSKYVSFKRPKVAAVTMVSGPYILKSFSGAWNIKTISDSSSLLVFTYNFELKGGIIGRLLQPLASFLFRLDMRKRLHAIKLYIEQPPGSA